MSTIVTAGSRSVTTRGTSHPGEPAEWARTTDTLTAIMRGVIVWLFVASAACRREATPADESACADNLGLGDVGLTREGGEERSHPTVRAAAEPCS